MTSPTPRTGTLRFTEELLPGGRLGSREQVEAGFRMVLEGLGLDLSSPHLRETPERTAKAWWEELCRGLTQEPPTLTTFPSPTADEMVMLRDVPIYSLCAHHLLPFLGTATIAYVPGRGAILGVSKLSRLADYWARRPQVQEDLTAQIADALWVLVEGTDDNGEVKGGVGVIIQANHLCMMCRGVKHSGHMVTSALRGVFRSKPEARAEFLSLAEQS